MELNAKPLVPHRPDPGHFPIDALDKAAKRLEELESEIKIAGREMGDLAVRFTRAKARLSDLYKTRSFLKQDQDAALAALQAQDAHQEHQVPKETSPSRSSRPVSPPRSQKRPLPTGLIPKEKKKKMAADSQEPPAIWPKTARVTSASRSS